MSLENGKTATITDVARLAGVSEQTVSRTVRDSAAVRPATKERVREAMRQLGYRPSFAGRSLRRGHYRALGIVMFNLMSTGNLDRLDGYAAAAERTGYALTLITMNESNLLTLQQAADRMSVLPVDGMIYTFNREVSDFESFRPPQGLDTVLVTMHEHPVCSTVDNDQWECSRHAVEYLLERGHKTVHHIAGPGRSQASAAREEGWRDALRERGIEPPGVLRGDWTPDSGYEAGLELAADPSVTAVYASNDAMAYGCIRALEDSGRRVPDDVSVIGVDDILKSLVPHVELTSLRFDNRKVGDWAVNKMAAIREGANEREHKLFPSELVERGSVRDLR